MSEGQWSVGGFECLLLFNKEDKAKWDRFWRKNGSKSQQMVSAFHSTHRVSTVQVSIKARVLTVKGARGTIVKDLSHMSVEMQIMKQKSEKRTGNYIRLRMWFGQYKQKAQVKTCTTLIKNMLGGVVEVSPVSRRSPPQSFIRKCGCLCASFSLLSACQFY